MRCNACAVLRDCHWHARPLDRASMATTNLRDLRIEELRSAEIAREKERRQKRERKSRQRVRRWEHPPTRVRRTNAASTDSPTDRETRISARVLTMRLHLYRFPICGSIVLQTGLAFFRLAQFSHTLLLNVSNIYSHSCKPRAVYYNLYFSFASLVLDHVTTSRQNVQRSQEASLCVSSPVGS